MKHVIYLILGVLILSACEKNDIEPIDLEAQDPVWMKISIPEDSRGISAVYGDIDDTLVVATMFRMYITTDKGVSWELVSEYQSSISGFYKMGDELIALRGFLGAEELANNPFLFSRDHGKTWEKNGLFNYEVYDEIRVRRNMVSYSNDIFYRIDDNLKPISQGTYLHGPNKLFRVSPDHEEELYFPSKRYFNYLYLDANKRLYIGANGNRFEGDEERFVKSKTDSSLIYISREPVSFVPVR